MAATYAKEVLTEGANSEVDNCAARNLSLRKIRENEQGKADVYETGCRYRSGDRVVFARFHVGNRAINGAGRRACGFARQPGALAAADRAARAGAAATSRTAGRARRA